MCVQICIVYLCIRYFPISCKASSTISSAFAIIYFVLELCKAHKYEDTVINKTYVEPILRLLNLQLQRQRWRRLERFSK
jgi:hypothetical protein